MTMVRSARQVRQSAAHHRRTGEQFYFRTAPPSRQTARYATNTRVGARFDARKAAANDRDD